MSNENRTRISIGDWLIWLILTIVVSAIIGFVVSKNNDKIERAIDFEQSREVLDDPEIDSAYTAEPTSITEILQLRDDVRQGEHYDSIFLHMPDAPLIAILLQYGTDLSMSDIGRIYEEDQQTWDNVQLGSQIYEKYIQPSIKEPDPLPEALAPDSTSRNNNLTKKS